MDSFVYGINMTEDELKHYGVLGMKWGVRRYQNYDGTRIGTKNTIQKVQNRANKISKLDTKRKTYQTKADVNKAKYESKILKNPGSNSATKSAEKYAKNQLKASKLAKKINKLEKKNIKQVQNSIKSLVSQFDVSDSSEVKTSYVRLIQSYIDSEVLTSKEVKELISSSNYYSEINELLKNI